jgi:hypothetical protein
LKIEVGGSAREVDFLETVFVTEDPKAVLEFGAEGVDATEGLRD